MAVGAPEQIADSACPTLGPGVRRRCTIFTARCPAPDPRQRRGDGPGGRFRRASLHEYAAGAAITCGLLSTSEGSESGASRSLLPPASGSPAGTPAWRGTTSGWLTLVPHMVQRAWVGDIRAARMAGGSPARAPMTIAAVSPP